MDSAKTSILWVKSAAVTSARTALGRTENAHHIGIWTVPRSSVCMWRLWARRCLLMSWFCLQCKRDAAGLNKCGRYMQSSHQLSSPVMWQTFSESASHLLHTDLPSSLFWNRGRGVELLAEPWLLTQIKIMDMCVAYITDISQNTKMTNTVLWSYARIPQSALSGQLVLL